MIVAYVDIEFAHVSLRFVYSIRMNETQGTTGYNLHVERFIATTEAVDFADLHGPYLDLIPTTPCRVLDVGAGVGRDASVLASMGHNVTAVEPLTEFRNVAIAMYASASIHWVDDSLPALAELGNQTNLFDFILASAVWHHLNNKEQLTAMSRVASLLQPGGTFAVSLRNGPAGAGTHVFPTDPQGTIDMAMSAGLKMVVSSANLPSLIAGKIGVTWAKLAFRRI